MTASMLFRQEPVHQQRAAIQPDAGEEGCQCRTYRARRCDLRVCVFKTTQIARWMDSEFHANRELIDKNALI
ncbi:hypothetical protein [Burkholderia stagnalis]|uniref:hypothetical protein n=1 Tax=Burkholderia stagnalis TaxID=1503054 RepID=UPI000B17958C|nr:hypothetical protein [Burkholderia stagnalis]